MLVKRVPANVFKLALAASLCIVAPLVAFAQSPDAIDETLALVGLKRGDLGWTPKGWWPRFPDVPYRLRAFEGLFAAPLECVPFARALADTAWARLDPARLDTKEDRLDGQLLQAVQRLGIDPRFGGFRGYSANLVAPLTPLDEAVLKLTEQAGRPTRIYTFGWDLPYPRVREELADRARVIPHEVSLILGQLVLNLADAHRWAELTFRKVDARDRLVVATRYDVAEEMTDAYDYIPSIDDVARSWDEASLWYAALKCVQAVDDARVALQRVDPRPTAGFAFDWESPLGWIRVRGPGDDEIDGDDTLLVVDLGGNDRHTGACAAASATRPISVLLDLAGNDRYEAGPGPAQGAGLSGVGFLLDAAGSDCYRATRYAQGVGQFGLGVLADLGGDDEYTARFTAQGCGLFGIGLLLDAGGHDKYRILADGQGLGGVAGVGVLADRDGDDVYIAERKHSVTGRPSYHSPNLDVGVSNAQGVGIGRRGDGSDGHSWAGGLGMLLDGGGDDAYTAGNWAQGTGYWFGIGVLHDRSGDDVYRSVAYGQASGAHFCVGILVDETGNDQHLAEENSNMCLAWGHDFTVAVLFDAAGNDLYRVDTHGLGYSINRSVALLVDGGGDDRYETQKTPRPGYALNDERFRSRDGVTTYFADTTSLGLFLDVGGHDTYWGELRNDTHWLDPPDAPNWADRNFSVGVDRIGGSVSWAPVPVRPPTGVRADGGGPTRSR